jgi:hypothetical protein
MSLEQSATPSFANHQTFHPRFGWLKKGFDAAVNDPEVFNRPDAPVILGVGKNMVEAIRFWCTATRVLAKMPQPDRPRLSIAVPTGLGTALLGDDGLDPYMEDPSTLWVLHWQALSSPTMLPIWWSTFNDLTALEFTEPELVRFCVDEVADTTWSQPNESSIQKDVDCLLRMYTARETRHRQSLDDLLDSPFRELGLMMPAPAGKHTFRFIRGNKPTLSSAAITYACLDFLSVTEPDARTVSLSRLTSDSGSPGRIFKLTEDSILEALEESVRLGIPIRIASPAGTSQLMIDEPSQHVAAAVLLAHHALRGRKNSSVPGLLAGTAARLPVGESGEQLELPVTSTAVQPRARRGSAA